MALTIPPYKGQGWTDDSTPDLCAETLNAVDAGITANSNAINAIANAVVSQIVNDPNKIASMAALYAVNKTVGDLAAQTTGTIDLGNGNIIRYSKRGYIVDILVAIETKVTFSGSPYVFGNIPAEFRPTRNRYINVFGASMLIQILANGDIATYQSASNVAIYGQCSYSV